MTSYSLQFLIFLLALQAMTTSSRHTNSKKTTRLARMPIYFGKRARKFPESSHGGTNVPGMIWHHTLYSKVSPGVTREEFNVVDGEYSLEMNGSSQNKVRLSHPDPWNCHSGSALSGNDKQSDTNVQTVSNYGRQNNGKTPGKKNNKVKMELEFKHRNFAHTPQYAGNSNSDLLKSSKWSDLKHRTGARDTKGMKLISQQMGDYVDGYPLFVSPDAQKLFGVGVTDPVSKATKLWGLRPSVLGHQRRLDMRSVPKSAWVRIEQLFKDSQPHSERESYLVENLGDVTGKLRPVVVHSGRGVDRGKLSRKKTRLSKRRYAPALVRIQGDYGISRAQSHSHSSEKWNHEPPKIWSPEERADDQDVLSSRLGAIVYSMTNHRSHVTTAEDNFYKSVRFGEKSSFWDNRPNTK